MKNVNKKTQAAIDEAQKKYEDARAAVNDTLADGKDRIESLISTVVSDVNLKVGKLNEALMALEAIRDEVSGEIVSFIDEKSDAWRDGERGSAYGEWSDAWGNQIEEVEEIDIPSIDDLFSDFEGNLDGLNEEPLNDGDFPREPSL